MKYVVILIVVVILVRIDFFLRFFDKTSVKIQNRSESMNNSADIPSSEIIPAGDGPLIVTPRKTFLSMLNNFIHTPDEAVKNKAIEVLRSQPSMFSEKLDSELESAIYRWRDLLAQKNKVTHEFLMEMMKSFKGENLEMVRRFFSFAIDIDMGDFLSVYSKSTDTNCLIMGYLGDNLPEEEKYNELNERLLTLENYLSTEKTEAIKTYAGRCQMVLKLQVDKLRQVIEPIQNVPTEDAAEAQPSVDPTPTADPGATP